MRVCVSIMLDKIPETWSEKLKWQRHRKRREKKTEKKKRTADFQYMYKVSSECGLKPDSSVG